MTRDELPRVEGQTLLQQGEELMEKEHPSTILQAAELLLQPAKTKAVPHKESESSMPAVEELAGSPFTKIFPKSDQSWVQQFVSA